MSAVWNPDARTIDWALATIDETAVGDAVIQQLSVRAPELLGVDPATLGETAVECVLFAAMKMINESPGPYGHAGPV